MGSEWVGGWVGGWNVQWRGGCWSLHTGCRLSPGVPVSKRVGGGAYVGGWVGGSRVICRNKAPFLLYPIQHWHTPGSRPPDGLANQTPSMHPPRPPPSAHTHLLPPTHTPHTRTQTDLEAGPQASQPVAHTISGHALHALLLKQL